MFVFQMAWIYKNIRVFVYIMQIKQMPIVLAYLEEQSKKFNLTFFLNLKSIFPLQLGAHPFQTFLVLICWNGFFFSFSVREAAKKSSPLKGRAIKA